MRIVRETVVNIECEDIHIVHRRDFVIRMWCAACGAEVQMVTPETAARITGTSWREVGRRVEVGRVHSTETTDGMPLICVRSLGN